MMSNKQKTIVINITTDLKALDKARREGTYVYCGRPSKWGNKYTHLKGKSLAFVRVSSRGEAVRRHREDVLSDPELMTLIRDELAGKVLGCFCRPLSCHCDTLAEVANGVDRRDYDEE